MTSLCGVAAILYAVVTFNEVTRTARTSEPLVVGDQLDQLGADRWLPRTQEGDVLLIATCGAYGYAMASNYNLRPPAAEFMIEQ